MTVPKYTSLFKVLLGVYYIMFSVSLKKTICCCVNIEMSMPLPYLLPSFNGCVTQSWNKHIFGNTWPMRLLSAFPHVQKHSYLIYRAPEPPLQVSLTNVGQFLK